MRRLKLLHILQALAFAWFAVFTLGFSHVSASQSTMAGMEHTPGSQASIQCQILCSTAVILSEENQLLAENKDNNKPPFYLEVAASSLAVLGLSFVVKRLYLLASWRPPDKVLLCGHYSDGL